MTKQKPDEKNIHSGHRMRVINSYRMIDFNALSPHQVLEYILFYVFPRGDVNPLAHRLLKHFGTIQAVLEADQAELEKVYGISKHSAQMLAGFVKIFDYYTYCKLAKRSCFESRGDIYDYTQNLLKFFNHEVMFYIAVDATYHVIANRKTENQADVVGVDTHDLCDFINETRASYVLICHSHPGRSCVATQNDLLGNEILKNVVIFMNAKFIDHIIVGQDGLYSIESKQIVRTFTKDFETEIPKNTLKNAK